MLARFLLSLLYLLLYSSAAQAQVALSGNVQLLYDDNIYLEDDNGLDSALTSALEGLTDEERSEIEIPKSRNGDPDDDFITNASIGFATPLEVSRHIRAGTDTTFGFAIFSSETDETRLTLDSKTRFRTRETLLPEPYFAELSSNFTSGQGSVGLADGTSARQSQNHDAEFAIGAEKIDLGSTTTGNLGYLLRRHDFLGEFTLNSRDDRNVSVGDDEIATDEEEGSDYFVNRVHGGVENFISPTLIGRFLTGVELLTFTDVSSRNPELDNGNDSDLDRINYDFGFELSKTFSPELQVSGSAGADFTFFTDSPSPSTVTSVDPDGNVVTEVVERDDSESSFNFGGSVIYTPIDRTSLNVLTSQSSGINIDGERVIVRTVAANVSQGILEKLNLLLSGRFTQFDRGDSLSDSTDRFEVSLSAQVPLAESLVLSAGWNYVDQSADEERDSVDFLADNNNYEVNRAFVSVSGGLVGLTR